jgi:hypothetical protein
MCGLVYYQSVPSTRTLLGTTTCGGYKSGYKGRKWYKGPKLGCKCNNVGARSAPTCFYLFPAWALIPPRTALITRLITPTSCRGHHRGSTVAAMSGPCVVSRGSRRNLQWGAKLVEEPRASGMCTKRTQGDFPRIPDRRESIVNGGLAAGSRR